MGNKYIDTIFLKKEICSRSYVNKIPSVDYLRTGGELSFVSDVTFFVGENGTGKSTLIEAIAIAYGFNPEGGSKNASFSTKKMPSTLSDCITFTRKSYARDGFFLKAESFYNVATYIDDLKEENNDALLPYGGVSLHEQSHGESFISLVQNRFGKNSLFILDEPEAALSPSRIMTLMVEMNDLVKDGCQFIIATHSPMLMAFPNATIYEFSKHGIKEVSFKETEHYRISKQFLNNPEQMLKYLFED